MELFIIIVILLVLWFINENTKEHRSIDKFVNMTGAEWFNTNGMMLIDMNTLMGFLMKLHRNIMYDKSLMYDRLKSNDDQEKHFYEKKHSNEQEKSIYAQKYIDDQEKSLYAQKYDNDHDVQQMRVGDSLSSRHGTEHKKMIILDNVEAYDDAEPTHSSL